jgi:CRISP-associated protein Cas1
MPGVNQQSPFLTLTNFQAAWAKVAKNNGCAGVDGETIAHFRRKADIYLADLLQAVKTGTYQPLPLRPLHIPKKAEGWRGLAVPTVRDRIVQQALLNVLHPLLEPQFESCSFAYRPGRSYKMAVQQIDHWHDRGYNWVLDADIVQYFSQVKHQRLLAEVRERLPDDAILALIQDWLAAGVLTGAGIVLPQQGLAQGAVISPILANVYLDDFDEEIAASKLKLVRYSDDFVILGKSQQQIITAKEQVANPLADMGLELHADKTQITNFDKGFRFLGHLFAGELILPSKPPKQAKRTKAVLDHPPGEDGPPPPRLIYSDSAHQQPTQMQQALLAAVKASVQPIPPPLYVVLGYTVRPETTVKIESKEVLWKTGMSTLYLVQQQSTLRREQGRFLIQSPDDPAVEIPIQEVERILVFGNVQLTTAAISTCLDQQIPVVFLTQLGEYKGHLWTAELCDLDSQSWQFQRQNEADFQLEMAMHLVWGKLRNSRQSLLRWNRKKQMPKVIEEIARLAVLITAVETAPTLDALRGYEGTAARLYFSCLGQLLTPPEFKFTERNRRPPKDPVNSLLSFGYTLLFNNVLSLILAEGLNPYLGNLHRSDRKEPHLAFDLMEEFRAAIVDSLVLTLINKQILKPTDFTWPDPAGGIYLQDPARRVFLKHFEERMSEEIKHPETTSPISYRRIIQMQVHHYKSCLRDRAAYEPFLRAT